MSFGDLELHGRSDIFSLALIKVVQGRVQLPITDFYKALGQLHGPWCKQPLRGPDSV